MTDGASVTVPPQIVLPRVVDLTALRAVDSDVQYLGNPVIVLGTSPAVFCWFPLSIAVDNGTSVIRPDDRTSLQAGRWLIIEDVAIRGELSAPGGAALVGFIGAAGGAVARTVQSKLRDVVSAKDFGATGDGVTNDTTALNNALTALADGGTLFVPPGTYLTTGLTCSNKKNVRVNFEGKLYRPDGAGITSDGITLINCTQGCRFVFANITTGRTVNPASFTADLKGAAVRLQNCIDTTVEIDETTGFLDGANLFDHSTGGTYFCDVRLGRVAFTCYGTRLQVEDTAVAGFVNGNSVKIGSFRGYSAFTTLKGAAQTDPFNGNEFSLRAEECAYRAVDMQFAAANLMSFARFEPPTLLNRWIYEESDCNNNLYICPFMPLDKLEIKGLASRLVGTIAESPGGAWIGYMAVKASGTPNTLAVLAIGNSTAGTTINGIGIEYYSWGPDLQNNSFLDDNEVGFRRVNTAGIKRVPWDKTGQVTASNVDTALPNNINYVQVATNTTAVKLFLKNGDFKAGNSFNIDVTAYTNTITIRDQADTIDIVAAGVVNSVGLWEVFITGGLSARAFKLA